jgi:hypothetical protein
MRRSFERLTVYLAAFGETAWVPRFVANLVYTASIAAAGDLYKMLAVILAPFVNLSHLQWGLSFLSLVVGQPVQALQTLLTTSVPNQGS